MSGIINSKVYWGNPIKVLVKKLIKRNPFVFISKTDSSILENNSIDYLYTTILAQKNSKIVLGKDIKAKNVRIIAEEDSLIEVEDGCNINNTVIFARQNSVIKIGKESIIGSFYSHSTTILAENAHINIGIRTKLLMERMFAKWGGRLTIGKYSGFGYFSDIRCDEKVILGDFTLCSYNVSIYDSNVHSTDFEVRRKNIIEQYPGGLVDIEKPETSPVILGNDVWIGRNASIMKGCEIADRSIIGSGTVVANIKEKGQKTFVAEKAIRI